MVFQGKLMPIIEIAITAMVIVKKFCLNFPQVLQE